MKGVVVLPHMTGDSKLAHQPRPSWGSERATLSFTAEKGAGPFAPNDRCSGPIRGRPHLLWRGRLAVQTAERTDVAVLFSRRPEVRRAWLSHWRKQLKVKAIDSPKRLDSGIVGFPRHRRGLSPRSRVRNQTRFQNSRFPRQTRPAHAAEGGVGRAG